jgi:hypothetical protein
MMEANIRTTRRTAIYAEKRPAQAGEMSEIPTERVPRVQFVVEMHV